MSADSAEAFTAVFFSLEDAISAGTITLRSVLSNGAEVTRATCFIDAAANILISFEPSCRTWKPRDRTQLRYHHCYQLRIYHGIAETRVVVAVKHQNFTELYNCTERSFPIEY